MTEEFEGVAELKVQEVALTRSLGIERVYNLGDYKSIRFSDFIANLPERVALDAKLVDKVRYLQLVNVELHYRQYLELAKKVRTLDTEKMAEILQFLEEEKSTTLEEIKNILFEKE